MTHLNKYTDTLDSVRFRKESEMQLEKFVIAYLEILISMLFGQRIMLTENQLLDSTGLLFIASELLDLWQNNSRKLIGSPFGYPLGVAFRKNPPWNHLDFRSTIASVFRQTYATKTPFALSAWQEIDENDEARLSMADEFEKGNFLGLMKDFDYIDHRKFHALEQLDGYLNSAPADVTPGAGESQLPMQKSISVLNDLSTKDIEQLASEAARQEQELGLQQSSIHNCLDEAITLVATLKSTIPNNALPTHNRSGLYMQPLIDNLRIGDDLLAGLREIFSCCYNASNASSVSSNARTLSNGNADMANEWVLAGNALGQYAVAECSDEGDDGGDLLQELSIQVSKLSKSGGSHLSHALTGRGINDVVAKSLVQTTFEILCDEKWKLSAKALNDAISRETADEESKRSKRELVDEAFQSHVFLLADYLKDKMLSVTHDEDGKAQVGLGLMGLGAGIILDSTLSAPLPVATATISAIQLLYPRLAKLWLRGRIRTELGRVVGY